MIARGPEPGQEPAARRHNRASPRRLLKPADIEPHRTLPGLKASHSCLSAFKEAGDGQG